MTSKPQPRRSRHGESLVVAFDVDELEDEHVTALRDDVEVASVDALVLDLSRVAALGTDCLGALVALRRSFAERRARLVLLGLQPAVAELLAITKLGRLFEYRDGVDEALEG